ncbi:hypothetical protein SAY87_028013 [Trapa incisa]|uniref:Stress enhanced protein 2 n=1 Tax=Trapa incisa TaxID=236973 RepID=A0AAN7KX24_9MYRT|nr:hypothetical protein SAY87_028013 [Trapa incisa]
MLSPEGNNGLRSTFSWSDSRDDVSHRGPEKHASLPRMRHVTQTGVVRCHKSEYRRANVRFHKCWNLESNHHPHPYLWSRDSSPLPTLLEVPSMAMGARTISCQLQSAGGEPDAARRNAFTGVSAPVSVSRPRTKQSLGESSPEAGKIMLQPRLCTLRSYGPDRPPVRLAAATIKTKRDGYGCDEALPFFETLSEYIESSKKSHDFEIISGRLAMIVFAATVTMEAVTGNSLFRKMDVEGIAEASGLCVGAVVCAAVFAWFSSARNRVGRIFTTGCNSVIDSLIDQIVDGLFYEIELSDWSDEI